MKKYIFVIVFITNLFSQVDYSIFIGEWYVDKFIPTYRITVDSAQTIISGLDTIDLIANVEAELPLQDEEFLEELMGENLYYSFYNDSTGIEISFDGDPGEVIDTSESFSFSWYATEDSLFMIDDEDDDPQNIFSPYEFNDDTLIFSMVVPLCPLEVIEDCLESLSEDDELLGDLQNVSDAYLNIKLFLIPVNTVKIIENKDIIPQLIKLYQNYPNPFNPVTSLRYDLPEDGLVNITVYDMMGRIVKTLVNSSQTAGYKSIRWNATNDRNEPVSAGLYLYTIQAGEFRQTKKMVLLK